MSASRPELVPLPDVDDDFRAAQLELQRAILHELRRLNDTVIPLAEAARKRMPFTWGRS